ncbi:winged helix-turn-helix transcriptional regulator [Chryseobacterium balustinum]|uniref:winged helix-turn-helix transcriptional regulator n=1 Tax=Chryseobacterium balustinum TaxID=246 RepID=UPI003CFB7F64
MEFLAKKIFPELPPLVEYSLTPLGEQLIELFWKLNDWGRVLLKHFNDELQFIINCNLYNCFFCFTLIIK